MLPKNSKFIGREFAVDTTLVDAALDPDTSPTRRMIANASIGMGVDDAYLSVRELREAVTWIDGGEERGRKRLVEILSNRCDDYQRCIYYSLAGRGAGNMLADLYWLELLLLARGRIAGKAMRARYRLSDKSPPYVATEPDGVVPAVDSVFEPGESWRRDPGQRAFRS